jgi:N-methylhydantoinase B
VVVDSVADSGFARPGEHDESTASFVMEHRRTGPHGLFGGFPGAMNEIEVRQGDTLTRPEHLSKGEGYELQPGDWVQVRTLGGGHGDPAARSRVGGA